jgi:hypothetical protein
MYKYWGWQLATCSQLLVTSYAIALSTDLATDFKRMA